MEMEKEVQGKIISVGLDAGDVITCDDDGYVLEDDNDKKRTLVYVKDRGVFRIIGWTSKMGQIVHIKHVLTGEDLTHAPLTELKKLMFEYINENKEKVTYPLIVDIDYKFLYRHKDRVQIIDEPSADKVKCHIKYYNIYDEESSGTKPIYYAKLCYSPDEIWNNIINETKQKAIELNPSIEWSKYENLLWDLLKENYYPPIKIKNDGVSSL